MFRKRLRIFFRLKKEEFEEPLLDLIKIFAGLFIGIAAVSVGIILFLFAMYLLGFGISLLWKYPFLLLAESNPKSEIWPIYIIVGGWAIVTPMILSLLGWKIKTFVIVLKDNWEKAGKLAEVEEHDESIKKILKVTTK